MLIFSAVLLFVASSFCSANILRYGKVTDAWHTKYHRHNEIIDFVNNAADRCGKDCTTEVIGQSAEKRALLLIKIGQKSNKPIILIDATIHAREWIAPATAQYLIDKLTDPSCTDPLVRKMKQKFNFHILAVLNPDGYEYTFTGDRYWRKSRRLQVDKKGRECNGVDMNRNFGHKWGGIGSSGYICSNMFRGHKAFSEPASAAWRNYMLRVASRTRAYLTLHSFGQYWLFPWGYRKATYPANVAQLRRAAEAAAAAQERVNGRKYVVGSSADIFSATTGGSDDYALSLGIPYSYTLELPPTHNEGLGIRGFALAEKEIISVGKETIAGLAALTDNME